MKRKFVTLLLALTCFFGVVGMTACDNMLGVFNKPDNSASESGEEGVFTVEAAYAKAQELGYEGTLEEFIKSISGKDGADGKSAYQIWVDAGNTGSEADFLAWVKGEDGAAGTNGVGIVSIVLGENEAEKACFIITYTDGTVAYVEVPILETPEPPVCEHTYAYQFEMNSANNCVTPLRILYVCNDCNHSWVEFSYKEHMFNGAPMDLERSYSVAEVELVFGGVEAATCIENSAIGCIKCEVCNINFIVNVTGECRAEDIKKVVEGESFYQEQYKEKAATCDSDGWYYTYCTRCGKYAKVDIEKLEHAWSVEPTTVKEATCSEPGYNEYTCTVDGCGVTTQPEDEKTPKLNCKLVIDEGTSDFENGKFVFVCERGDECGYIPTPINATTYMIYIQQPTCERDGKRWIECTYTVPDTVEVLDMYVDLGKIEKGRNVHYWGELKTVVDVEKHTTTIGYEYAIDVNKVWTESELKAIFGDLYGDRSGLELFGNVVMDCLSRGNATFCCSCCVSNYLLDVIGDHDFVELTTWVEDGVEYTGYCCSICNQRVIVSRKELSVE